MRESATVIGKPTRRHADRRQPLARPPAPVTHSAVVERIEPELAVGESASGAPPDKARDVRYLVRAVMDNGHSVSGTLARRCDEDLTLSVRVVNFPQDVRDFWIDEDEFEATGALFDWEPAEPHEMRNDDSVLGTIAVRPHETAMLALMANDAILATAQVEPAAPIATLVVSRRVLDMWIGRLEVRVIEAGSERPIVGATVHVFPRGMNTHRSVPSLTTDSRGYARASVFPAYASIWVRARGYVNCGKDMTIHGEGNVYATSVALTPTVSMSGRVLDAAGRPVFARVEAKRSPADVLGRDGGVCSRGGAHPSCFTSLDTGEFEIPWLPAGEYELSLHSPRGNRRPDPAAPPLVVSTYYGPVRDIVLTWHPDPAPAEPRLGHGWSPGEAGPSLSGSSGPPTNPEAEPR